MRQEHEETHGSAKPRPGSNVPNAVRDGDDGTHG